MLQCVAHDTGVGALQVWEVDRKLLQQHALPTVEAYGYTTETLLRALDMDEFLPGPVGAPAKLLGGPRVSRRAIRAGRCKTHPFQLTIQTKSCNIDSPSDARVLNSDD